MNTSDRAYIHTMYLYVVYGNYEATLRKLVTLLRYSVDDLEAHLKEIDNILKPLWAGYKNGVVNAII